MRSQSGWVIANSSQLHSESDKPTEGISKSALLHSAGSFNPVAHMCRYALVVSRRSICADVEHFAPRAIYHIPGDRAMLSE